MYTRNRKREASKFCKTYQEFGVQTSFHGVRYTVAKDNTIFEKILWSIVILLGVCGSCYMAYILWERFSSNPIRVSIESNYKPTTTIPFPAITLCSVLRIVPDKVEFFLNKLILPENITKDDVKNAIPSLIAYTHPVLYNESDIALLDSVFRSNNVTSVQDIFSEIEPTCKEMLLKCRWEKEVLPCDQLFRISLSRDGHCCSFNSQINQKKFQKYRTVYFGMQLGLSLIVDPITSNNSESFTTLSSSGMKILIHSPEDYPGDFSTEKILANGTETFVRVLGSRLISSVNVESLTATQRGCLFANEKRLLYFPSYRHTNCELECRIRRIYRFCKCVPFRFGIRDKPVCNITDIPCLNKNYHIMYFDPDKNPLKLTLNNTNKSMMGCDCPPRCNDIFYNVQTSNIPLSKPPYVVSRFYETNLADEFEHKMVIRVYFGSQFQLVMLRDTVTSIYNLFSSLGGVFGLFLGSSFLSILEIIYFFCFRLFKEDKRY